MNLDFKKLSVSDHWYDVREEISKKESANEKV